jgi:nucleoside-diphosphate-sugar epimerase
MKKVLVTGATGFVGRHCLPLLIARGYEVHALGSRVQDTATIPSDSWHDRDLLDKQQVSDLIASLQPTHLLHCAWYAVPGKYWTARENYQWVESGIHMLETFASHGGQRVVGVGSCAEYDWRYGYCSETLTPLNPATTYGICKHTLQLLLSGFSKQTGLSSAWGRLFFLYGPYEQSGRLVASVIRSLLQEQPALCSQGQQIRDFLYVQDAADALVALLDSNVEGAINIASGIPVSVADVVEQLAELMQHPELVRLGALPETGDDPHLLVADTTRLRNELGWSPRYQLSDGLSQTIRWWKLRK